MGELEDPESGAHPYAHAAWRLLAIAYQEIYGQVPPEETDLLVKSAEHDIEQWMKDW